MDDATDPRSTGTAGPSPGPGLSLLAAAVGVGAGVISPGGETWGIHAVGRLGAGASVAGLLLIALSFLPGVARAPRPRPGFPRVHPALLAAVTGLAFGLLAHGFRVATQLLGDGHLIARDFELVRQGTRDVQLHDIAIILRSDFLAPLSSIFHLAWTRLGPEPAGTALALESVVLGAVLVALLTFTVARARVAAPLKAWAAVLTLFSPTILLYFGYVENYTAAHLALGVYAALGLRAVNGKGHPALPTAVLLLATGLHVQALVWWPSLLFLWLVRNEGTRGFAVRTMPWLVPLVAFGVALLIAAVVPQDMLLAHATRGAALWSPRHGSDFLQTLWLAFPLVPFAFWLRWRHGAVDPAARARLALADLLVFPTLVYLFVIDPTLGAARDWDRAAFVAWAMTLQVLVLLGDGHARGAFTGERLRRWLVAATAIAGVATISWVGLNHSGPESLRRIEDVVLADPQAQKHGFEALARYHGDREEWAEAGSWARRAYQASGNPRLATLASQHLRRAGRADEALPLLERALGRKPDDHRVRYELVRLVWDTGDPARTLEIAAAGAHLHPRESIYPFFAGLSLYQLGRRDEAHAQLVHCLTLRDLPDASRRHARNIIAAIDRASPD